MSKSQKTIIYTWGFFLFCLSLYIVYGFSKIESVREERERLVPIISQKNTEIQNLSLDIEARNKRIVDLSMEFGTLADDFESLNLQKSELEGRVAGLFTERDLSFPFSIPSEGVTGSFAGTFGGNMYGMRHLGIDIWTTTENNGRVSGHKGNPVYSVCSGVVDNMDKANGAITIKCDKIADGYLVPELEVYTYYAHMGNGDTGQLFINVSPSQRVDRMQLIGYQGDLSKFFPEMRNVHLHFSVFGGLSEVDKKKGAYNPCLYIGGDCSMLGSEFRVAY